MSGEGGAIAEVREALDYLVRMAIGHDYADGYKISTAEDSVLAALGDVADLLAAERQRGREEARTAVEGTTGWVPDPDAGEPYIYASDLRRALADVPAAAEGER